MKTLILFLLLLSSFHAISKPNQIHYGYWIVTYTTEEGYKTTPTISIIDVIEVTNTYFPENCINFEKILKENVSFEYEQVGPGIKSIYIEVKKVNHRGKFRSLNKKEVKEYLKQ